MPKNKTTETFAERLADLIADKNISLEKIGKEIGISKSTLSKYTNDEAEAPIGNLVKLANYFNVSADYLLGISEAKTNDKDLQFVCDYTGLSAEVIEKICEYCIPFFTYRNELRQIKEENNQEYQDYEIVRTKKERERINSIILSSIFDEMIRTLNSIENINDLFVSNLAIYFGDFEYFEKLQFDEPLLLTLKDIVADNSKTVNLEDEKNLIIYKLQKAVIDYFENASYLSQINNPKKEIAISQMQYINTSAVENACEENNIETLQNYINQEFRNRYAFKLTKEAFEQFKTIFEELKKGGINGNDS